ncbi:MAG: bifunctional phosphopantothenoylcysteine decarboxylase/phosphopantothenate--cysteine ligase CoaBC [Bacteroidota bacterium]
MLKGKKILLAITGSIAAYKAIILLRLLVKENAEVKVVLTPAASDFVSPLVLETLSKNEVIRGLASGSKWSNHVMLGRWADLMIVAPASCNTLSKMANGSCDNLLLAVYLSATCPVWIAPAMDEDMWKHPSTKRNIKELLTFNNKILQVGTGELASGLTGEGRMCEPEEILDELHQFFKPGKLNGLKAFVTAGPTHEKIDPVRFIGNNSSGKMGIELALALEKAGAETTLVIGPVSTPIPATTIKVIPVQTALEMQDVCAKIFPLTDIAIMAAAVADYRPKATASEKIKKSDSSMVIELVPNPDILKHCGSVKNTRQILVGFALETNNEEVNARSKLANKNASMIVLNSLNDAGSGFGTDTNKVTVFEDDGKVHSLPLQTKKEVATEIVSIITERWYENKDGK